MSSDHFTLKSRDEVERFEMLMSNYSEGSTLLAHNHVSLTSAWDLLQQRSDGGKVFAALLDTCMAVQFTHAELIDLGSLWNTQFSPGKIEGGSILDSAQKFCGKMDIHRHATGFVLRYRAAWDKIMGLFVLVATPASYDQFAGASSKKKAFRKLAPAIGLTNEQASGLLHLLQSFDDKFRTAEAHGTGVLRKWALTMQGLDDNPMVELLGYWNQLNRMMVAVGAMFGATTTADAEASS